MENKNNVALYGVVFLVVGLLLGYLLWGRAHSQNDMHMMADGQMMHNMPMPSGDMQSMMDGMMAGISGKTGSEFDQAFLREMIVHHQGAVVMAEAVLKNSQNPELIKLANDIITAQTSEIKMMQMWQQSWPK